MGVRIIQFTVLALGLLADRALSGDDAPPRNYDLAFSNGLHPLDSDQGGLNGMPTSNYTAVKWPWGTIPQVCYDIAKSYDGYCEVYDTEVYNVTYSDVRALLSVEMDERETILTPSSAIPPGRSADARMPQ